MLKTSPWKAELNKIKWRGSTFRIQLEESSAFPTPLKLRRITQAAKDKIERNLPSLTQSNWCQPVGKEKIKCLKGEWLKNPKPALPKKRALRGALRCQSPQNCQTHSKLPAEAKWINFYAAREFSLSQIPCATWSLALPGTEEAAQNLSGAKQCGKGLLASRQDQCSRAKVRCQRQQL